MTSRSLLNSSDLRDSHDPKLPSRGDSNAMFYGVRECYNLPGSPGSPSAPSSPLSPFSPVGPGGPGGPLIKLRSKESSEVYVGDPQRSWLSSAWTEVQGILWGPRGWFSEVLVVLWLSWGPTNPLRFTWVVLRGPGGPLMGSLSWLACRVWPLGARQLSSISTTTTGTTTTTTTTVRQLSSMMHTPLSSSLDWSLCLCFLPLPPPLRSVFLGGDLVINEVAWR